MAEHYITPHLALTGMAYPTDENGNPSQTPRKIHVSLGEMGDEVVDVSASWGDDDKSALVDRFPVTEPIDFVPGTETLLPLAEFGSTDLALASLKKNRLKEWTNDPAGQAHHPDRTPETVVAGAVEAFVDASLIPAPVTPEQAAMPQPNLVP